jgi:hypothetical protein
MDQIFRGVPPHSLLMNTPIFIVGIRRICESLGRAQGGKNLVLMGKLAAEDIDDRALALKVFEFNGRDSVLLGEEGLWHQHYCRIKSKRHRNPCFS